MGNTKSLVLMITSLTFLISQAVFSQLIIIPVFADPPHSCMDHWCPGRFCDNDTAQGKVTCCWGYGGDTRCQTCHIDLATGDFFLCTELPPAVAPPPSATPVTPENALPQGDVQQPTPPTGGKGLFGSEGLPTPPTGLAPPTEPPAPTSEPTVPPNTDQGEDDGTGGGGTKPPVKDLLPDSGITEQPDVQQPEEEPSNEGQDTAGPLT